jgi:hypothetical protein
VDAAHYFLHDVNRQFNFIRAVVRNQPLYLYIILINMNKTLRYSFTIILLSSFLSLFAADYLVGKYQQYIAQSSEMSPGFLRYHASLGWTLSPNWQGRHQHHDFDVNYQTNLLGYRGPFQTFTNQQTKTVLIGDSFTFGLGVNDEDTFSHQLNQMQSNQYLNLGIPGYSTDQQWLLIEELSELFNAKHYLLFFYLGNDLIDNALSYPMQANQAKPVFQLNNGELTLEETPISRLPKSKLTSTFDIKQIIDTSEQQSEMEQLTQRSNLLRLLMPPTLNSDGIHQLEQHLDQTLSYHRTLAKALLNKINAHLKQKNVSFTLVTMPNKNFILNPNSASAALQDYVRRQLIEIGGESDIPVYDLEQKMKQAQQQPKSTMWFHPHEGHLNAEGHKIVAQLLNEEFKN